MGEYYDYERERRLQISLAESTLDEQIVSMVRTVDDLVRELRNILSGLIKGDASIVKSRYEKVRSLKDDAEKLKDGALRYMVGITVPLESADAYKAIFIGLARLAMLIDGAAYRSLLIVENTDPKSLPAELGDMVVSMAEAIAKQFEGLINAARLVSTNPRRSGEEALKALRLEDEIDLMYRKASIMVYRLLRDDIIALMLVKDLVELLEEVSDHIRDIAENVRLLALYREVRG